MRQTPYQKLYNRKRKWTPVQTTAGQLKEGSEETIRRILAIRHMELPVGEFIKASLKEVPSHSMELLLSNIKDEENHDIALGYAVKSIGEDREAEAEAKRLRDAWMAHPAHTIAKALVAERGIFFTILPFMRFNGDAGLRTISADISRDEQIHVATNSLLCTELNLDIPPSLDKLRKATVAWIYEPLGKYTGDKYLSKKFWQDQSDNLMYKGKTNGLSDTKKARMPAFFEHSNVNLPQYS